MQHYKAELTLSTLLTEPRNDEERSKRRFLQKIWDDACTDIDGERKWLI